jgi:hypothetical protein
MNSLNRCALFFGLTALASIGFAQPAPSSTQPAKEQRQSSSSKPRPDRSQAEAKKIKGAQKEAKELQGRKMDAANAEMSMGIASGAPQAATRAGAKKTEKFDHHKKDTIKKSAQ